MGQSEIVVKRSWVEHAFSQAAEKVDFGEF
jgi:hypothetical protein